MDGTTVSEKQCHNCGHTWLPRTMAEPRICPKCKSHNWRGQTTVPVAGMIPAGPLAECRECIIGHLDPGNAVRWKAGDFFLLVSGDSMTNGSWRGEDIRDGDHVLIRPNVDYFYGEIAAVRVNEDGVWKSTLKRLCYNPGDKTAILKALNPAYPDIEVSAKKVSVAGVYRGLIRSNHTLEGRS